jgi:hypothetical protein
MRKNILIVIGLTAIIFAVFGGWLHFHHENERQDKSVIKNASTKNGKNPTPPTIDQKTQTALQMVANAMKNMGWKEIPPIQQQIQSAINSKDTGAVIRAFHDAVYAPSSRMAQTIPALQSLLTDSDPWVRFQAAEDLYIAGDNSGDDALIDLLKTDHPIRDYDGSDIRTHAAEVLIKYRDKKAINALMNFDRTPHNDWVVTGLAKMMGPELPEDLIKQIKSYNQTSISVYNLSFVSPSLAKDLAQITFSKSKDGTQAKADAAWALLKAGEREPYYSYLMDYAKKAVVGDFPPPSLPDDCYLFSLKILASMKDAETKSLLEDALASKNIEIVEVALVNLFFNQGGSDEAKQYLLNQFRGPTNLLADSDFDMQLAAVLNDPQINAAAKSVDDRTGTSHWAYFEDRKNWSVYTWIDDYVVDLNGSRQIP